jgi:hypothetical protein
LKEKTDEPFIPRPNFLLLLEVLMEFLTQQVSTLADYQSTVLWSVRKQIDKTLQATESRLLGILVLVGPGRVGLDILPVGESDVDGIEGYNYVLCIIDLLESLNYAWLLADGPSE